MTHIPSVNLCEKNSCFVLWGPNLSFWLLVFLMPTFWKKKKKRSKVKKKHGDFEHNQTRRHRRTAPEPPQIRTPPPPNDDVTRSQWWRHKKNLPCRHRRRRKRTAHNTWLGLLWTNALESGNWKKKKLKTGIHQDSFIRTQQLDVHLVCRRRRKKNPKSWRVDVKTYISHSFFDWVTAPLHYHSHTIDFFPSPQF